MQPHNAAKKMIAAALPHAIVKVRRDTYYQPEPHTQHVVTVEGITTDEYWQTVVSIGQGHGVTVQHIEPTPPREKAPRRRLTTRNYV